MLLELYILLEVLALLCFGIAFFRKNEWIWSITMVLTAILIFASYNIEQTVSVIANQTQFGNTITYNNIVVSHPVTDKAYSYFNIGLFAVALVLFLNDIFMNWKDGQSGQREI